MTQTLFIADLHLDKSLPRAVDTFQDFLVEIDQQQTDALYILGDLFEYWLGDDCVDKTATTVANALAHYHTKTQTPIFFIHGNRDFLLNSDYARKCHMTILPEYHVINLYGVQTLLCHGDTLCTDDTEYMNFRTKVRDSEWQQRVLKMPKWLRYLKAMHLRWQSKKANQQKNDIIMDVSYNTVVDTMTTHDVTQMIHGHTHRPDIHFFSAQHKDMARHVVGDWYEQGSVLKVTPTQTTLLTRPFN